VDLDVCYARTEENFERIARALAPFRPWLRGAPRDLPFTLDARTLRNGLNFMLSTEIGDVDLLGELTGVGGYAALAPHAAEMELYGHMLRVISLEGDPLRGTLTLQHDRPQILQEVAQSVRGHGLAPTDP
jgi:hypothetical protein